MFQRGIEQKFQARRMTQAQLARHLAAQETRCTLQARQLFIHRTSFAKG